jgi:hypothetical protein
VPSCHVVCIIDPETGTNKRHPLCKKYLGYALKVLNHNNIKEFTLGYIMRRWTIHANTGPCELLKKCASDEETRECSYMMWIVISFLL